MNARLAVAAAILLPALLAALFAPLLAAADAAAIDDDWQTVAAPFVSTLPPPHRFTRAHFIAAATWVGSRAFGVGGGHGQALVPLADAFQARLFAAIPGLSLGNTEPLCEYYNPLTAACDGASGFGWSAAHALLMVTGGGPRASAV